VFDSNLAWNLELPAQFDAAAVHVTAADVREVVRVSSDLSQHLAWLQEYVELGVDSLYLHHVGQTQDGFIDAFGQHVLPTLQEAGR
jgi:alkanesulfonate monooxygenase SsuD/methylene tetrahydromethanopterin reductase-like flavin-dependent oxidoreductase (luciferase family)